MQVAVSAYSNIRMDCDSPKKRLLLGPLPLVNNLLLRVCNLRPETEEPDSGARENKAVIQKEAVETKGGKTQSDSRVKSQVGSRLLGATYLFIVIGSDCVQYLRQSKTTTKGNALVRQIRQAAERCQIGMLLSQAIVYLVLLRTNASYVSVSLG